MTGIKNGIMYLRKSRKDIELERSGEGETLKRHETILLGVAKNMNLNIVKIYREIVSADSISARPEVQKVISEVENGNCDFVLVMDADRLARGDTIDQGVVARAFKAHNTLIITPTKTYDPSNEADEEYFEFNLFMARREYQMIKRRIQRGRVQSATEGKYLPSIPPYGYDRIKIPNGKGYTLTPNPYEAEAVRLAYRLYVGGVGGATTIAKILDAKKYKPRNSNTFTKATLKDMLKNPVYVGLIRWGKVMVPGLHEPLIDKETFERAQQIAKTNYHAPTKVSLELQNPLAGLVYCKKCGSLMTRLAEHPRNKYATLKCPNTNCSNVSAPLYLVEQEILSNLKNWLYVYSMNLNEDSLNPAFEKIKEERALISKLQSELKKVAAQIAKTYELLEQEVYTVDVFLERNQTLKQKQDELLSKIALSETEISNQEQTSCITLSHAEELLNSYSTSDPAADRNQILKLLVSRITYNKDTPNRRGQIERRNFEIEIFPILPTKNN